MKALIGSFAILLIIATACGTPLERKRDGPLVVDVPADMFTSELEEPIAKKEEVKPLSSEEKDTEVIKAPSNNKPISSEDETNKENEGGLFGTKFPAIFIIRRPQLQSRFPFFQSSPFQFSTNFRPFSIFDDDEDRRPISIPQRPITSSSNTNTQTETFDMLSHMEQMMKRMQQQMSSVWSNIMTPTYTQNQRPYRPVFPSLFGETSDESSSAESKNENKTTSVIDLDNLPPNYSNTTSETKVVDGHVIQVNKTIHKISSGDNSHGFFQFQVINVRPTEGAKVEEPAVTTIETEPNYSSEAEIKPEFNETPLISKNPIEIPVPKAEDPTLNEVGATGGESRMSSMGPKYNNNEEDEYAYGGDDDVEVILTPPSRRHKARSLADDTKVNQIMEAKLMSNRGNKAPLFMVDPDVEFVDV